MECIATTHADPTLARTGVTAQLLGTTTSVSALQDFEARIAQNWSTAPLIAVLRMVNVVASWTAMNVSGV